MTLKPARNGSVLNQPALSDLIVDKRQELVSITLGNGFSGVTEIQTGPDGLMCVLSLGGKISGKSRPQYLNCHLQMDRLSVYFSCTLSVISLLAVFHLSDSSVLLIYKEPLTRSSVRAEWRTVCSYLC
ncbi:MAG: hypothetical protein WA941_20455 [Nitrososphaeraceae archaeon]